MADPSLAQYVRSGIYEIVNTTNGKRYIGSAAHFWNRWKLHRFHLDRGTHHSKRMQASWVRDGAAVFKFNVLLECSRKNLLMYEQILLDALSPEYNTARIAGSCLGVRRSEETKEKLSAMRMGNKHTLGYKHRPESIEKIRAAHIGVPSPTKGLPRNPEAIAATAAAHRGMKRSDETRAKISAKAAGRKRSPVSVELGAAKLRGIPLSPERRAKLIGNKNAAGTVFSAERRARISEFMTGQKRPKSPEHRAKIAAALLGRKATQESRMNQSAAQLGKKRGPYKPMSPETRARSAALRAANKARQKAIADT